jgi:hypothetical protein
VPLYKTELPGQPAHRIFASMLYEHVSLICIISMVSAIRLLNVPLKMLKVFPSVKSS